MTCRPLQSWLKYFSKYLKWQIKLSIQFSQIRVKHSKYLYLWREVLNQPLSLEQGLEFEMFFSKAFEKYSNYISAWGFSAGLHLSTNNNKIPISTSAGMFFTITVIRCTLNCFQMPFFHHGDGHIWNTNSSTQPPCTCIHLRRQNISSCPLTLTLCWSFTHALASCTAALPNYLCSSFTFSLTNSSHFSCDYPVILTASAAGLYFG